MIYMKSQDGTVAIIVLETANLEEIRKGRPARTPDGSILIAHTPDPEWLAQQIMASGGDVQEIGRAIDEASKRPEKPLRPYHEHRKIDLRENPQ